MKTVTQWFIIDAHGQPKHVGWYDVLYKWEDETTSRRWWNGKTWEEFKDRGDTFFGNAMTAGERWRGLAVKPRSGIKTRSPKTK